MLQINPAQERRTQGIADFLQHCVVIHLLEILPFAGKILVLLLAEIALGHEKAVKQTLLVRGSVRRAAVVAAGKENEAVAGCELGMDSKAFLRGRLVSPEVRTRDEARGAVLPRRFLGSEKEADAGVLANFVILGVHRFWSVVVNHVVSVKVLGAGAGVDGEYDSVVELSRRLVLLPLLPNPAAHLA